MDLVEALGNVPGTKTNAKLLVWDIENSPATGRFWGSPYNTNIVKIVEPSHVMSFAAKWVGEDKVHYFSEYHHERDVMLENAWNLINEADALISYNGKRHDTPHINTEFLLAGLRPPTPVIQTDLYQVMKKIFKFQQNKLDFVSQQLGIGAKLAHEGYDLWEACMDGDSKAWAKFKKYNISDIHLTESLYWEVLPWIPQYMHPNPALYGSSGQVCGICGSNKLTLDTNYMTTVSAYPGFVCQNCGKYNRGKSRLFGIDVRGV